ncbi:hypothetical protein SO694_00074059 [Aureococcus anophagefferens]|uniref:ShKT domain-containing protein n=1 Tax=Aureococcus anophagefferens TaxID=44056 RepID=A0ABR1FHJ3_AURAN
MRFLFVFIAVLSACAGASAAPSGTASLMQLFENLKRICFGQAPPVFAPKAPAEAPPAEGLGSPGLGERSAFPSGDEPDAATPPHQPNGTACPSRTGTTILYLFRRNLLRREISNVANEQLEDARAHPKTEAELASARGNVTLGEGSELVSEMVKKLEERATAVGYYAGIPSLFLAYEDLVPDSSDAEARWAAVFEFLHASSNATMSMPESPLLAIHQTRAILSGVDNAAAVRDTMRSVCSTEVSFGGACEEVLAGAATTPDDAMRPLLERYAEANAALSAYEDGRPYVARVLRLISTDSPTLLPTYSPTGWYTPTYLPTTLDPTMMPTSEPTYEPTAYPSSAPTTGVPTSVPVPEPTRSSNDVCEDSTSWYYKKSKNNCEGYVSKKAKNCKKKDEAGVRASEACPMTCQDSCNYASDGECDDPTGTDLCESGTDTSDCGGVCAAVCEDSTSWYYKKSKYNCEDYVSKKAKNCKKKDEAGVRAGVAP